MWVTEDILQWLVQNQIVFFHDVQQTGEDRYEFIRSVVLNFENGILFGKIANQMAVQIARSQRRPETPLPQLDGLKELNSPAAKIYNWNILVQVFKKFSVTVDPDVKSLIIAGDHDMIQELLKELQAVSFTWNPPAKVTQQSQMFSQGYGATKKGGLGMQQKKEYKETIDLTKLDIQKDVSKSKSCLEFFIIILSKHLELDPKQTASLFTHGNKYLAHVLAKGVKGLFDPIVSFYSEVYKNVPTLIRLFSEDSTHKSMFFSLNALKPGLVSKSFDVADWAARLFSKLAFEFNDTPLLVPAWEWFIGQEGQGLNMVLLGLKRHPDLKALVVSILLQFARFNYMELFTTNLKRGLPDPKDLINCYTQLLPSLMEQKSSREQIVSTGILDDWIDTAFDSLVDEFKNYDLKCAGLNFLAEVWLTYPAKIEDQEMKANNFINLLAKSVREKSQALQYTSLVLQFRLLLQFGLDKNPYAPIIYKTLTLSAIEFNTNSQMREFILNNFITIFETIPNIPIHILIEPLINQIKFTEQNQFLYNVFDFNFFNYISKNDKLSVDNAVQLFDLLAKVYLNNIIYPQMAMVPMINLIQRNLNNDKMQEFVIKFVKISLAMFYASEKKRMPKEKIRELYNNKSTGQTQKKTPKEMDAQFLGAQKRSLIVQIIKNVIELGAHDLNEKIKPLVAHTNIQIKNIRNENNAGMMSILECFGDPEVVIKKYEDQFKEHQKLLKQEEKDALDKEQEILAQSIEKYQFGDETKDETLLLIEQNLSKYGIGHKHTKLTKDEITRLALLRNPKASKKTLQELKQIKENFHNKQDLTQKIIEKNQSVLDVRKKTNRTTLARRALEQGVSNFNQIDQNSIMIYEFGKREAQLIREGKMGIPQIIFIDLETEEIRDKEMVTILMKKYHKALRYMFLKFANTGFNIKQKHAVKKTFDELKDASNAMSIPEAWKMIQEFGLHKLKGKEKVFIKQDQYYKELTINKERVKNSKLNRETGIYEVDIERDFDMISPTENELIVKITNKFQNEQKTKKIGLEKQSIKDKNMHIHQNQDQKYASSDQRGQNKTLAKAHQNLDKTENQNLDYEGFYQYFIQISVFINSKYPSDLRHLPMSASVQVILDRIRNAFEKLKLNTNLFDSPEGQHFGENEVIQKFNKELETNPGYPLPEGYTKKREREITFSYEPPLTLMPENYQLAYDVLNDILKEALDINMFQPKSTTKEVVKAHPLFNDGMQGKSQFYNLHIKPQLPHYPKFMPKTAQQSDSPDISQILKKGDGSYQKHIKGRATQSAESLFKILPGSTFNGYVNKYGTKRNLQIDNYHKMSLSMKLSISQFDYKNRFTAEQVGFVLDDMIKVIENGNKRKFVKEGFFHPENAVKQYKEIEKQQKAQDYMTKQEKYKKLKDGLGTVEEEEGKKKLVRKIDITPQGQQLINEEKKKQYEEGITKAEQKRLQKIQEKKEAEEKAKEEADKKIEEKKQFRERWVQKQKQKALESQAARKEKQDEEKKLQQEKQEEEIKKKKEEFKQFNDSKIQKYEQGFKQVEETRKQKAEEEKMLVKMKKPRREKLYKKIIENDAKRNEFERDTEKKIKDLVQQDDVQEVFLKYKTQLTYLFDLLKKYTYKPIGAPRYEDEITLKTFNWFCFHFSIYPEIIHYVDSILIYRSSTQIDIKGKKNAELRQIGMDYDRFLEALVRLACKGKNVFNSFAQNIGNRGDELNKSNVQKMAAAGVDEPDKSMNQSMMSQNDQDNNPENKELDGDIQKKGKYIKLVDDYGKIENCNAQTVECLVLYLALPDDRQGMDDRFRSILEEGYKPDLKSKKILTSKMGVDPTTFAKNKQSRYQRIDEVEGEEDMEQQQNNNDDNPNDQSQQQDQEDGQGVDDEN